MNQPQTTNRKDGSDHICQFCKESNFDFMGLAFHVRHYCDVVKEEVENFYQDERDRHAEYMERLNAKR